MTPAHTRLKANSVPIEMASARSPRVMKKAKTVVNTPVRMVPMNGISNLVQ